MNNIRWIYNSVFALALIALTSCTALGINTGSAILTASGTIEADSVHVSAEIGGKLADIKVDKGDVVKAGDVLIHLDDQIYQAQLDQAKAAVQVATASLSVVQQRLSDATTQYNMAIQASRLQDAKNRNADWKSDQPSKFTLPGWYFQKDEEIQAIKSEVDIAQKNIDSERANLDKELKDASNKDFIAAEKRLEQAQVAYKLADQTLTQAKDAKNNTELTGAAQKDLDSAQSELDAAQQAYNQMLSSTSAKNVLEARARVAVAQARLDNGKDALDQLMTGDQSFQVQAAQGAVQQAKGAERQAEAALTQAQAALKLSEVQLSKTLITAPAAGVVLSRPMSVGETTATGATVLEIGVLDEVKLTVYLPEDQYGKIKLGQTVSVKVDSFPGKTFSGPITHISDQAEFTPRNVQTVESRSTTVYAIEIRLPNPDHALKPGMPADATF
jgi:HlyD family secretion protein